MGDEAKTTGSRRDEQIVQTELSIEADVAGKIVRAVDALSALSESELHNDIESVRGKDHELTVYLVN